MMARRRERRRTAVPTQTPRARAHAAAQSLRLPPELLARVLSLLSWRDSASLALTSSELRSTVLSVASTSFEWRSTAVLTASDDFGLESANEVVERLVNNHGGWADAAFAPSLALISVRCVTPRPWTKGGFWREAAEAVDAAGLLPPRCLVVGMLAVQEPSGGHGPMAVDVAVGHLPCTTVQCAEFDRKELRRNTRIDGVCELENPFPDTADGASADFLLFSVNPRSAEELASAVAQWRAKDSAIVGGVFPFTDIVCPLMAYRTKAPSSIASAGQQGRRRKRRATAPRRQDSPLLPVGEVIMPSNLVIRLCGQVRLRPWASSGFAPVTPVVRCEHVMTLPAMPRVATYDLVSVYQPDPLEPPAMPVKLKDLLRERIDLSSDKFLQIVASPEPAVVEALLLEAAGQRDARNRVPASPYMINCGYNALDDAFLSIDAHWERGWFATFLGHCTASARSRLQVAIDQAHRQCEAREEVPFGMLKVSMPTGDDDDGDRLGDDLVSTFSIETDQQIGPLAMMSGLVPSEDGWHACVQQYNTCGVLFCRPKANAPSV